MKSPNSGNVLVLVGDATRARVVQPGESDTLDVVWEAYAASPHVRSLEQAPDINRNTPDATPTVNAESNAQFAFDVSEHVRILAGERPGLRLLIIAPPSFASALKVELGSAWPTRSGDVIPRDETKLDDESLRWFIKTTLDAHPLHFDGSTRSIMSNQMVDDGDTGPAVPRGDVRMLSSSGFQSLVLEGRGPIAVEFMSYGCAHCRVLEPIVQEVADLVKLKETIYQVNVAVQPDLAAEFGVEGTPTFVMFLNGQAVGRADGPSPTVDGLLEALTQPFE